ncbi:MAG: hypothetical protein QNJ90_12220 [Planctomycetota bacterium]|nr:hypothetical protein [Planctomycetota bacterium]
MVDIYETDDQPSVGLIKKLVQRGYIRRAAREFLGYLKTLDGRARG